MKEFMCELAKEAGQKLIESFDKVKNIENKGARDIVTNIDKNVEKFVVSKIKEKFPNHSILGEEFGEKSGDNNLWIIDPLDGTKNYTIHMPVFNVAISFAKDKEVTNSVVYSPILDELFYAEKNKGAFLNDKKISVSDKDELKDSFVCFCRGKSDKAIEDSVKYYKRLAKDVLSLRQFGSGALELAYVAAGRIECFYSNDSNAWDVAGGSLLIREAGGQVTDFKGNEFRIGCKNILATNKIIHNKVLSCFKE